MTPRAVGGERAAFALRRAVAPSRDIGSCDPEHFNHYIDILGACNLRCPSCPVGNSPDVARPSGLMSPGLFTQIVRKIRRETPRHKHIHLYNWTEATLHPELAEFIRIARRQELETGFSTNLDLFRRMEEPSASRRSGRS